MENAAKVVELKTKTKENKITHTHKSFRTKEFLLDLNI